jgi:hypothetical protein
MYREGKRWQVSLPFGFFFCIFCRGKSEEFGQARVWRWRVVPLGGVQEELLTKGDADGRIIPFTRVACSTPRQPSNIAHGDMGRMEAKAEGMDFLINQKVLNHINCKQGLVIRSCICFTKTTSSPNLTRGR